MRQAHGLQRGCRFNTFLCRGEWSPSARLTACRGAAVSIRICAEVWRSSARLTACRGVAASIRFCAEVSGDRAPGSRPVAGLPFQYVFVLR